MMAPQLGFRFGGQAADPLSDRRGAVFYPQGHLRPGVTSQAAAAQAEALWDRLMRERPKADVIERLRLVPFHRMPNGAPSIILPTLGVLGAMALLVLLIVCANVAGLVLVRGVSRRGEIAMRLALGASRQRVVRLLIVENLVLAVPGAVLGVLLARSGIPVLVEYAEQLAAPARLFFNVQSDHLVIGFAALVACASALVMGLVPALQSSRVDLVSIINADASPRAVARGRFRTALVVAQVAVSLLLLVGAGLATRSVEAARRADPGFDPGPVTVTELDLTLNGYDAPRGRVFYRKLLDTLRAAPGVEAATLAAAVPLGILDTPVQPVAIDGYTPQPGDDLAFMSNLVGSDYFRTLRMRLVSGRGFEDRDDEHAPAVAVVNQTLAERFWGSAPDAIGKRVRVADGPWREVIGVAADAKYSRIDERPRPYLYLPFLQAYRPSMVVHVRGTAPVDRLLADTRRTLEALDPDLPIVSSRPMKDGIRGALIFFDLTATMLFLFGAAGMALSVIGTYGLVSYTVRQSAHEIGIRMVLGASAPSVLRRFLGRGLRLGAIGAALGIAAALAASRLLGSMVFGVSPTDVVSFAQAVLVVLGGVVAATAIPAWQAARTNPLRVLRHQ
jgi:predicted permease